MIKVENIQTLHIHLWCPLRNPGSATLYVCFWYRYVCILIIYPKIMEMFSLYIVVNILIKFQDLLVDNLSERDSS